MRLSILFAAALAACGGRAPSDELDTPAAGSSGSGGAGGGAPVECGGTITFRMLNGGPTSASQFCLGATGPCVTTTWLEVFDAAGQPVNTFVGCNQAPCSTCQPTGCPTICAPAPPLPAEGIEMEWSGVRFADDVCGAASSCLAPACAAPGSYVARFCAHALIAGDGGAGDCASNAAANRTCVERAFEYPWTGTVEGVLDP